MPTKVLVADKVRPNEHAIGYVPARGRHIIECSLFILPVIIEVFFLMVRERSSRELPCINYQ
jgi:hypothetical protein